MVKALLDASAVLLVLTNFALGWRLGAINRLIMLGTTFVATCAASFTAVLARRALASGGLTGDNLYTTSAFYLGIFLLVIVMFEVLALLFNERIRALFAVVFDQSIGVALGIVTGIAQASLLITLGLATAATSASSGVPLPPSRVAFGNDIRTSYVVGTIAKLQPAITSIYALALPRDFPAYLVAGSLPDPSAPSTSAPPGGG